MSRLTRPSQLPLSEPGLGALPGLFAEARFKYPWRSYQARVLKTLDEHLQDDHLHVVAPPGSGKTVLGLEVVRRLGRPALVLVPTITIREQWLRRLRADFLDAEDAPGEVSTDMLAPATLTVSTYQALHSLFKLDDGDSLLAALRGGSVATLAVDEAHHLRSEWWRCLQKVKNGLPGVKTVALTGTPPYDAPQAEWNRYATFCGDVDEEIGVPELVLDGHLCPHQDLIYLCLPEELALEQLKAFRGRVEGFFRDLAIDTELAQLLASRLCGAHPGRPVVARPVQGPGRALHRQRPCRPGRAIPGLRGPVPGPTCDREWHRKTGAVPMPLDRVASLGMEHAHGPICRAARATPCELAGGPGPAQSGHQTSSARTAGGQPPLPARFCCPSPRRHDRRFLARSV